MPLAKDLLHHSPEKEKRKHKKCLVQSPNSYFLDVKCPGCYKITTVCSHAQMAVLSVSCSTVVCQPTGGKQGLEKDAPSNRSSTKSPLNQDERETIPINTLWIKKTKREWGHSIYI
uniref:40S ribosomal protein S27-like n=2 Tax=Equus asinus TaxID=9793 RepID=A0A9L0KMF0_EQUAS